MSTADTTRTGDTTAAGPRRTRRALGVLGGVLAAVVVWLVAVPVLRLELRVEGGALPVVGLGPVLLVSALSGLAGWALLAVLERFTRRARLIWVIVAVVFLLLSLVGPINGAVGLGAVVALCLMHVAVAAVVVPVLAGTARTR